MLHTKIANQYKNNTFGFALQLVGIIGALLSAVIFMLNPSFPTPDKIIIFLTFVFLAIGQAKEMLIKLLPFVLILITYDSFRGIADQLNQRVEYTWMIKADEFMFGSLPTLTLQKILWFGSVTWYDFIFYFFYMMHFVIPLLLAVLVWKLRPKFYWQYVTTFLVLSFAGFITFIVFPAAPPWLAAQQGYITEPFTRISSEIWSAMGIQDFPSIYNKISPNAVAAVPSLHAAYATMISLFTFLLFGKKWGAISLMYPIIIYVGTVYSGEHYAIDELLGILYALVIFGIVHLIFKKLSNTNK